MLYQGLPTALPQFIRKDGAALPALDMGLRRRRRVQVPTLGNVAVSLWLPYVVERSSDRNRLPGRRRKQPKGQGFYPFLRWVSMEEHITPLVWSTVAQYGMLNASFAVARDTLEAWGVAMSLKRIERLLVVNM